MYIIQYHIFEIYKNVKTRNVTLNKIVHLKKKTKTQFMNWSGLGNFVSYGEFWSLSSVDL